MRRLPPLYALEVFEVVARHGSFTRAAQALCVTQGAVSRQIQTLEDYYRFPLFKRHAKGLTLTAQGEQLLPTVRESLARIEEVSRRLSRETSALALKVPTCIMRWMLPRIMRFQHEHPALEVQVTTTWRHDVDFDVEPFDAAIVYSAGPGPGTCATPLFEEWLTPVCAPALLLQKPIAEIADLAQHTLLHPTRDHRDWRLWLARAGGAGVDAAQGPTFDTLDLATNAAAAGFGVAIGDAMLSAEDVAAHRLATPFELRVQSGFGYYFVCPERAADVPKIAHFRAWLAAQHDDIGAPSKAAPPADTSA